MKKPLVWTLALGLVALGSGLLLARRSAPPSAETDEAPLFTTQAQGVGRLLQLQAREPLRAIQWLPPLPGGWALCQVGTQSDRQLVALFQEGHLARTFPLPRLEGTSDGFYRQAEIRDAALAKDTLVLLVKADGGHRDLAVVMALSLEGELRWAHRTQADHLALGDSVVWAWGSTGTQRLPIATAKDERPNLKSGRANMPEALNWPYEAAAPTILLPTPSGFLLSHSKGLSSWRGEAGWTHIPLPAASQIEFPEPNGHLVRCAAGTFWQPRPGLLLKVASDGQVLGLEGLPAPEPATLDAALLNLLGCDDQGRLWFGLASPSKPLLQPAPPGSVSGPPPPGGETTGAPASEAATYLPPVVLAALEAHLKAPMDRIYTWKPGDKALRLITWSQAWPRLGAPTAVTPPPRGDGLRPEAQALLLGTGPERWWLPLKDLP